MCKRVKAMHYHLNAGGLELCLEVFANKHFLPEIDEIQQWCGYESRANILLGLAPLELSSLALYLKSSLALATLAILNI